MSAAVLIDDEAEALARASAHANAFLFVRLDVAAYRAIRHILEARATVRASRSQFYAPARQLRSRRHA